MEKSGAKAEGGGGRDASHGQIFHMFASMLIILYLWQARGEDKSLEYAVYLEKDKYGKWDDIVVRYKKKEQIIWTEICIQCKHASKNLDLNAEDLMSTKRKAYSLSEYLESHVNIRKLDGEKVERHLVFMCNKKFKFNTPHKNITLTDTTFYELNICPIIFQNNLFKFNLENSDIKQHIYELILNGRKKFTFDDVNIFLKEFSFCMNQNIDKLQNDIKVILNSICSNDCIAVEDVYSKLYQYIHSMLTDDKFAEMIDNDIDDFMTQTLNHHSKHVYFEIQDPSENFTGRIDEITKLQKYLFGKKENSIIDVVISGMAGVGKTQLILKFICDFKSKFNHILWINADSIKNMKESFTQLARKCKLISHDNLQLDINEIVENVYSYFIRKGKCLFVFDNALEYYTEGSGFNIKNFLPRSVVGSELFLIVTSQNIKFNSKFKIPLDVFTDNESYLFLEKAFDGIDDIPCDDMKLLGKTFQNFPLALELAASFIKQKIQYENLLGVLGIYSIPEFISEFKETPSKILEQSDAECKDIKYGKNVQKIWEMIINMFSKNDDGMFALKILNILSYFSPDGVPMTLFTYIGIDTFKLQKILDLIRKYSLCKIQNGIAFIHRLIQDTIRNNIEINEREMILKNGLDLIQKHLHSNGKVDLILYNNSLSLGEHVIMYPLLQNMYFKLSTHVNKSLTLYFQSYSDKLKGDSGITEVQNFLQNNDTSFIGPLNKNEFLKIADTKLKMLMNYSTRLLENLKIMNSAIILPELNNTIELNQTNIDTSAFEDIANGLNVFRPIIANFETSLEQVIVPLLD